MKMAVLTYAFYIIILVLSTFYFYIKWKLSYWKRRNVPYVEPEFIWGNVKQLVKRELSDGELIEKLYLKLKERRVVGGGAYFFIFPRFVCVDLDLIKIILQKEFSNFTNRGLYFNDEIDPLQGNLLNLENEKWKYMRTKLTPTFTSGKHYKFNKLNDLLMIIRPTSRPYTSILVIKV